MSGPREHIRRRLRLLDHPIDAISWDAILGRIHTWALRAESRYVCLCTLPALFIGRRDAALREAIRTADTAAPRGMLMAWLMRRRGVILQERIDAAQLLWRYADYAALDGLPIFFYGGTDAILRRMMEGLRYSFPGLKIAGYEAASNDNDAGLVHRIAASGARVVFVGLESPRQEIWMARMDERIPAVLVGVGGAFRNLARRSRGFASTRSRTAPLTDAPRLVVRRLLPFYRSARSRLQFNRASIAALRMTR